MKNIYTKNPQANRKKTNQEKNQIPILNHATSSGEGNGGCKQGLYNLIAIGQGKTVLNRKMVGLD